MSLLTRSSRRLLAALLVGVLAATPAGVAAAEPTDEPGATRDELAELIELVLAELGGPGGGSGALDEVLDGATDRVADLLDEGLLEPEAVDALGELIEAGAFDEISIVVEATRERRDAFRAAAEALLEDLGIDVPAEGSLRDAIEAAGLTRDELAARLEASGVELPAPPTPPCGKHGLGCGERPAAPTPRPAPAPTPTTTRPPAPTPDPAPAQPAPPTYPEASPPPDPDYPTKGGSGGTPDAPKQPDYPTTGANATDADGEESL